jgi:Uma2 family endonuclease
MATQTRRTPAADRAVLRGVGWETYRKLRHQPRNGHLRMSYLDGTLILMSPQYLYDKDGWRLAILVSTVSEALDIPSQGTGTSTLRRQGPGPRKGSGKEPDYGFYFGPNEPRMRSKERIDLDVDPPPDLAIEVDHKADSAWALRLYARIGVPEVWRYRVRAKALWFGRLDGQSYQPIERSLNLPRLTPALVPHALDQADRLGESAWRAWLLDWARGLPEPPEFA